MVFLVFCYGTFPLSLAVTRHVESRPASAKLVSEPVRNGVKLQQRAFGKLGRGSHQGISPIFLNPAAVHSLKPQVGDVSIL
jgi:hypothetical protein